MKLLAMIEDNQGIKRILENLGLPTENPKSWSMTTLRDKAIKIGAKVVSSARYIAFQMAEVAVPQLLFAAILRRIPGDSCRRSRCRDDRSVFKDHGDVEEQMDWCCLALRKSDLGQRVSGFLLLTEAGRWLERSDLSDSRCESMLASKPSGSKEMRGTHLGNLG